MKSNYLENRIILLLCLSYFQVLSIIAQPEYQWAFYGDAIISYVYVGGDEFNFDELDYTKWRNSYPWGRNYDGTCYQEYMTDGDNISFEDGKLVLTAREEQVYARGVPYENDDFLLKDGQQNLRLWNYTSGMIFSKRKYKYGRFEIRCKLPEGRGLWPAFWLFGGYEEEEIDVFEYKGENPNKIHWDIHTNDNCDVGEGGWITAGNEQGDDFSTTFNKIDVVWANDAIFWGLNWDYYEVWFGNLQYKESVIANLGIANNSPCAFSPGPNSTTNFPAKFEIDYIRIFAQVFCDKIINMCTYNQTLSDPSVFTGKEISIGGEQCGNGSLNNDQYLDLLATEFIHLKPGFHVKYGAELNAKIIECAGPPGFGKSSNQNIEDKSSLKVLDVNNNSNTNDKLDLNRMPLFKVNVFPNPTADYIMLEFDGEVNVDLYIEIFNLDGQRLYSTKNIVNNKIEVDTSEFPNGTYIIHANFGNQSINSKFVK